MGKREIGRAKRKAPQRGISLGQMPVEQLAEDEHANREAGRLNLAAHLARKHGQARI
jgi:hypothetical protein